jgi:hypothetical protein
VRRLLAKGKHFFRAWPAQQAPPERWQGPRAPQELLGPRELRLQQELPGRQRQQEPQAQEPLGQRLRRWASCRWLRLRAWHAPP